MSKKIYTCGDVDKTALEGRKIAVIGYGAQGRAQARMLFESGVSVVVGVRKDGASWKQCSEDGLPVKEIADATKEANIVHILLPDEIQHEVYKAQIAPNLKEDTIISFSHGFNFCFNRVVPPEGTGVIMVAPKAPGTEVYKTYRQGFGVPALIAVGKENRAGNCKEIALAMAYAMQYTRAGVVECTFEEETYEDLFGEQAVLCGGLTALMQAGFEVLVERGYPAELAYFECVHETKLIVDLVYEGGMANMWEVVSNTAEFGGHTRGSRVISAEAKKEMHKILDEIEDGRFAKEFISEYEEHKMANLLGFRKKTAEMLVEKRGREMRSLFKKG